MFVFISGLFCSQFLFSQWATATFIPTLVQFHLLCWLYINTFLRAHLYSKKYHFKLDMDAMGLALLVTSVGTVVIPSHAQVSGQPVLQLTLANGQLGATLDARMHKAVDCSSGPKFK